MGLPGIPSFSLFGYEITKTWQYLIIVLVFALITLFILRRIVNSPFGRVLKSIREDAPIIAHSSIFRPHFTLRPFIEEIGLSKDRITIENRGNLILTKDPISIMDGVASTGEIKEKVKWKQELN